MQLVIYSHSSYYDVLTIAARQLEKFGYKFIVFGDRQFEDKETIIYDGILSYSERLVSCLEKLNDEIVLTCQEDHILYKEPNWEVIKDLAFSIEKRKTDFVKLCYTGNLDIGDEIGYNQFKLNPCQDFFAAQPTIYRTSDFISFLRAAGPRSIWDLELTGREFADKMRGSIYFDGTERRVGGHRNSNIFSCVLTSICKGKWNMAEYGPELEELFRKYKIDKNIRGTN